MNPTVRRALADGTRERIVRLVLAGDDGRALVGRMAEQLELRQPTVSHHVAALVEDGVLVGVRDGRRVWYSVHPERLDEVLSLLELDPPDVVHTGVLDRITLDLTARFAGAFAPETVRRYVRESHDLLADGARISRYLPSLTARFAADRLEALRRATASESDGPVEVLFVCVQNAARSQLAGAILSHLAGDRVRVRTAGSAPAPAIRSSIVAVLDEVGVPIGAEFPKPLTDEVVRAADVVVTMGCGDACPVYPGRRYLDWDLPDPAGRPLPDVRALRDDVERRVRELLQTLDIL